MEKYENLPDSVKSEIDEEDFRSAKYSMTVDVTVKDGSVRQFVYNTGIGWRKIWKMQ